MRMARIYRHLLLAAGRLIEGIDRQVMGLSYLSDQRGNQQKLVLPRTAKSTCSSLAKRKLFNDIELHLHHRHDHQLRHALQWQQRKWRMAAVP